VPIAEIGAEYRSVNRDRAEKAALILATNLLFSEGALDSECGAYSKALVDRINGLA
jgi:hypothetical protein